MKPLIPPSLKQLEILQHSLGLDQYGQGEMRRNHFCAGGDDETICRELVALGYIKAAKTDALTEEIPCIPEKLILA